MKPSTTSAFIAVNMENPVLEFEDFDRLVELYRTRVLRFLFVLGSRHGCRRNADAGLLLERLQGQEELSRRVQRQHVPPRQRWPGSTIKLTFSKQLV
jgi:hypothetical protein